MRLIDFETITKLGIKSSNCLAWAREALLLKKSADLPPKISQRRDNDVFINTMPCIIPELNIGGLKVVSRYPERSPAIDGILLLYALDTGEFLTLMDADWITAWRTGAVAALAIAELAKPNYETLGVIGLGNTARTSLKCLDHLVDRELKVQLFEYKNQVDLFKNDLSDCPHLSFTPTDSMEELISSNDVILSCVTSANSLIGEDEWFKPGVLVVPVHTKGFQNCDLFFDRVFVDDYDHVRNFKYFEKFKYSNELAEVLQKNDPGRTSGNERILSYNVGIALQDIYFAKKIYDLAKSKGFEFDLKKPTKKFWA